ncbi:fumarylacetoacetate hydrolase family protein [Chelatococcus sp. GCM10030263]|uniref:fumarylacetoacetate hydrolase family protein n=1 Tax=Chelatococcus sp. GCM10030263 TaxID=3273387 RepID=UPI00361E3BD9
MTALERIEGAAAILAAAHASGEGIENLPSDLVTSIADAYAVQERVAELLETEVAGWKVGFDAQGKTVYAPVLERLTRKGGPELPVARDAPSVIEVEIAFILDEDVTAGQAVADATEVVSTIALGMEVIQSRFRDRTAQPFLSTLTDNLSNGAYFLSISTPWASSPDLDSLHLTVMRDGDMIWGQTVAHPQGDIALPMRAMLAEPPSHCGGLKRGQFITTGTLCGAIEVPVPSAIAAMTVIGPLAAKLTPR